MMRPQLMILAAAATVSLSGPLLAQTASTPQANSPSTTTTTSPSATTTSHTGAYDALSEGNRKIVSAIYEAQLGSANDTAAGPLLTRDDIAAMRQGTGWGNVYKQLQQQGYVTQKNLGQTISSYNRSTTIGTGTTVVTTAGGDQIVVRKKSSGTATSSKAGTRAAVKTAHGKSAAVTTADGSAAGVTAAAHASAGGVSNASGNGNGQGGGGRFK